MKVIKSELDSSVNFVVPSGDGGFYEARFVQRRPTYFICYLSSHSGCNKGCGHCWLTASRQTMMKPATKEDFLAQAKAVFDHWKTVEVPRNHINGAEMVHFNWMARGEPLANYNLAGNVLEELSELALNEGLWPKFNISTIYPKTFRWQDGELMDWFAPIYPTIYYSFYSTDEDFRKKWLPGAHDYKDALSDLRRYQSISGQILRIHGCYIEGENDSEDDVDEMISVLENYRLSCRLNIVRFNPPPGDPHKESSETRLSRIMSKFEAAGIPAKLIPRVGQDCYASCGMFTTPEELS